MVQPPLQSHSTEEIENVLIYVCDSLRYDSFPDRVREMGVSGRAIATSTFTATGFSSILTGVYPVTHQVWNFEDSLAERPPLLTWNDQSGIDATRVWRNVDNPAKKPPLRLCGETEETTLAQLESPFTLVVHDRGGHMTYGHSDESEKWSSHEDFFDELARKPGEINRLYNEGVDESVKRFEELVRTLESWNELENTLVVFTSDHGELLGEYGGLYDHGAPIAPELINVPLVFAGAGLPRGERFNGLLSTADIAPTALSAMGSGVSGADGHDLWTNGLPQSRVARTEVWKQTSYSGIEYKAAGVWTSAGGHVRHLNPFQSRLLHLLGVHFYLAPYANIVRRPSRGHIALANAYLRRSVNYGEPLSEALVDDYLVTDFTRREGGNVPPQPDTEQLRQLGYLE